METPKLEQSPGESEDQFNIRKARAESAALEARKDERDRQHEEQRESPITRFLRCFDGS